MGKSSAMPGAKEGITGTSRSRRISFDLLAQTHATGSAELYIAL